AQGIKVLRGTIGLLEGIVEKLEEEPVKEAPPVVPPVTPSVSAPIVDTTATRPKPEVVSPVAEPLQEAPILDTPTVRPKPAQSKAEPDLASAPTKPSLFDRLLPSFNKVQAFWDTTLTKIRSFLPPAWNEKLSDWGLTGAIAGIIVLILVTTAALLPDTPAQVAKAPPNTIEAPPELKAPKKPQPVEPEPLPTPELTPEQSLIAAIQQQVADITDRYGSGLIRSVEANFLASRLLVKVSEGWYNLTESQQNKLADEMLLRSREMDFSKLEITDLKGSLLARSPVVGPNMVILKRQELAANL
ncbi:MAG TPA: hypothetical protein V6C85_33565, partial [Allocoleopsis sp.]